jgi:nicotinic acid mononucleotide adenylyltransferase
MKLIEYSFKGQREVKGFSKEEILEVKRKISKFREEGTEEGLSDYLKDLFPDKILNIYLQYLKSIQIFWNKFLHPVESDSNLIEYYHLKTKILNELNQIINSLYNFQLNCQNTKRFLKKKVILTEKISTIDSLSKNYKELQQDLKKSTKIEHPELIHDISFWSNLNKIKNPQIILKDLSKELKDWHEINEIIKKFKSVVPKEKRKKNKEEIQQITFKSLYNHLKSEKEDNLEFYLELIALLYENNIISIKDEFQNVLKRKEIQERLEDFLEPKIIEIIKSEFKGIIQDINSSEIDLRIEVNSKELRLEEILKRRPISLLSKFTKLYFTFLEERYSPRDTSDEKIFNYEEIEKQFTENIHNLEASLDNIDEKLIAISNLISPYNEILEDVFATISSLKDDIARKNEEFTFFLKTVREENLRNEIRNYISNKISEVNSLIDEYQDRTAQIIDEEFPQLKEIREIFKSYKSKIQAIKEEIHDKLDQFEEKDIDIYHNIRQWEQNFNKKTKELNYLISILLNKIVKNFRDLIEEEASFFNEISEISIDTEDLQPKIPLNYSLSKSLIQTLTEKELKERISELRAKISKISEEKKLYEEKLTLLEDTLEKRIKIKEGISVSNIQCNICREEIDLTKDKYIKCPFCQAIYHYLCVAFWLEKYNSCPSCQNQFLDPNIGLFESQEELE